MINIIDKNIEKNIAIHIQHTTRAFKDLYSCNSYIHFHSEKK